MMRKPFIAANWKMNKLVEESVEYGETLVEKLKAEKVDLKKVDVAVCVPFIHMAALKVIFVLRNINVGAQNMHYEESGAYTGEISPAMLKDMGIECVIIGHSERRNLFGETNEEVNLKARALIEADITPIICVGESVSAAPASGIRPILCVGESLAQREAEAHFSTVKAQLAGCFAGVGREEAAKTVIAYEPVWAIGTGKTATAEQANEMAAYIRSVVAELYGAETAEQVIIQYGGSVKSSNIAELMAMSDIDGALVGGAGLDPAEFAKIVNFDPAVVGKDPQ